jgi:hypothetical protein
MCPLSEVHVKNFYERLSDTPGCPVCRQCNADMYMTTRPLSSASLLKAQNTMLQVIAASNEVHPTMLGCVLESVIQRCKLAHNANPRHVDRSHEICLKTTTPIATMHGKRRTCSNALLETHNSVAPGFDSRHPLVLSYKAMQMHLASRQAQHPYHWPPF